MTPQEKLYGEIVSAIQDEWKNNIVPGAQDSGIVLTKEHYKAYFRRVVSGEEIDGTILVTGKN
jgi:hypothetical protein